ncbi:MAG TPA: M81 family metallopeptidase [Candidatus Polarisedimenticolia bacterium]|nr:M81 family metallopeptidase [Candidatus Polarisedimenticolia bacterium]
MVLKPGTVKRLAVARLWHEGNSFSPAITELEQFRQREWQQGESALAFYRNTATELGAAVAFAEKQGGWEVDFLRAAAASPGGPLSDAAFAAIRDEILRGVREGGCDALYLSLHGALVTRRLATPELELVRELRGLIGRRPLAISLDLHANLGRPLFELADIIVGYKTYPHIDMAATGAKTLRLLTACAEGRLRPKGALVNVGAILPSFNMRTTDGPMAEVQEIARQWMERDGILDVSIFGGFAYGDSPHAGASVSAWSDADPDLAQQAAENVAAALSARRDQFYIRLPKPEAGIAAALAAVPTRPVAVVDPADNPLSGGIGDTPGLLRALLNAKPEGPCVFAFFHDPALVAEAHGHGLGARFPCRLGGRLTGLYGAPVEANVEVRNLTDGLFRNRGPMEKNLRVKLGLTAVLAVGDIQIIVTESCQAPNDPGYFELQGIDVTKLRLLCVKAKNHFRAAFAPVLGAIIDIDAPGPAALDLTQFVFRHAPAHLYRGSPGR